MTPDDALPNKEDISLDQQLSYRVQSIKPSPTLAVTSRAAELRRAGKDIISLGAGEPDFDTPDHIKEAAIKAIHDGKTKYTAVDGTPELKAAVIDKFSRDNGFNYEPSQILVSCGAKQSFFNLALALLNPGDEVVIPAPYWVSYPDIIAMAEGVSVIVETTQETRFKMRPEQLNKAMTSKTRLVIINSPSNPTGTAYSADELKALAEVLLKYPDAMVATDDIYEHILWPNQTFTNILTVCPALYDRVIVLNGVSKAYAMTGWRIGYAGGPKALIASMKKIQSQSTSNPCSIAQAAATEALNGPQDCVKTMVTAFKERHDHVVERLSWLPGVTVIKGDGTFYSFPDFSDVIAAKGYQSDLDLAEAFLEGGVAMVPGSAFGAPGYMRLSFAVSLESLDKALDRLEIAIA